MSTDPSSAPAASPAQFIRFVVAAGLSVPVNLGSRILLSRYMPYELAIVVSHLFGMATAFVLTRIFVFERSGRRPRDEFIRFGIVNLVSVAQTWIVSVGLLRAVFPAVGYTWHAELVAHVVGLGTASITSFWGHRRFSFGPVATEPAGRSRADRPPRTPDPRG